MRGLLVLSCLLMASTAGAAPLCQDSPGATTCTQDEQCGSGMVCHFGADCIAGQDPIDCEKRDNCSHPSTGACAKTCDSRGGGAACPAGTECTPVGAAYEACFPSAGGGTTGGGTTGGTGTGGGSTGGGAACPTKDNAGCDKDDDSGYCENKGCYFPPECGGRLGHCAPYCGDGCEPGDPSGCTKECPSGSTCTKSADTDNTNVCVPVAGSGSGGGTTGGRGGSGTTTGGTTGTSGAGATGATGDTGKSDDSGELKCSAGATGSPAALWLVLVLSALVAVLRRRSSTC